MENNKIVPLIIYPLNNGYIISLNPTITGTGEPDASIALNINSTSYGAMVNADGVWSINLTEALIEGATYAISVTQTGKDGAISQSESVTFLVDTQAFNQNSITSPYNGQFINDSTPKISGMGKFGATIILDVNENIYKTIVNQNGIWEIEATQPLNEGVNIVNMHQSDMGNVSPAISISFSVDTISPSIPVITKPNSMGYESNPKPIVSGQAEPDAELNVFIDEKEYILKANKDGNWSMEVANSLNDDVHMIAAKQKDMAGNISDEAVTLFTVETVAPQCPQIYSPLNGEFLNSATPTITGVGKANNHIEINHNGKIYSSLVEEDGSWSVKITDELSNGKHSLNVYQVDKAGNVSPAAALAITIDTIAPLPPVVLYPVNDEFVNTSNFTVKGTAEADATIELKLAGKTYNTKALSDGSWTVQTNEDLANAQQYSIVINQIDMAKNTSPSLRVKFYLNTNYLQAPIVSYPSPDIYINTLYPTITGTGNVGAIIYANINNTLYTTKVGNDGSFSIFVNQQLPQGQINLSITQNHIGNISPTSYISFYVDTMAPVAPTLVQPTENQVIKDNKLIVRGLGEVGSTIDLKADNINYSATVGNDGMWEVIIDPIAGGIHTLIGVQKDKAGNYSPETIINCVIDNIEPANFAPDGMPAIGTVIYNPPETEITRYVIATLSTNKPVIVNNVVGTVFSRTITTNGISSFDFVDLENHKGSVDLAVTWIDDNIPVIDIQSTGNYFSSDKTINYYKAGASGIRSALINGVAFESGKVETNEGNYTVVVSDNVGNTATKSFVIDKTPPTVLGVQNNATYNTDVNIRYNDSLSGVKYATLNGNMFACSTNITTNGNYNFVISDFGDNRQEINFTIAK